MTKVYFQAALSSQNDVITGYCLRHSGQVEDALAADTLHTASQQSGYHSNRHHRQARGQEEQGGLPTSRENVGIRREAVHVEVCAMRPAEQSRATVEDPDGGCVQFRAVS